MCLQFFYLQIQICQVCIISLCGPWAKVAYLHFISSLCALHIYECHQLYQILFILSTSKSICFYLVAVIQFSLLVPVSKFSIFINIDISSIQLQYSFLSLYVLSFVAHLVLFTIPGSSRGVPVVGPSSSVQ